MKVQDKDNIKSIILKYNYLLRDDASKTILEMVKQAKAIESHIYSLRAQIHQEEEKLQSLKKDLSILSPLYEIVYEEMDIKEVQNKVSVGVINRDDARNN